MRKTEPTEIADKADAMPVEIRDGVEDENDDGTSSLQADLDRFRDLALRSQADFDNFKKRAARERQDAIIFANEKLLQKLIPVLDNFDMALSAAAAAPAAAQSLQTGVSMIFQQFRSALTESGLEEIDAAHQLFDPNFHEAVSQQESSEVPEGHVLQQLRKGYKIRERLLRPATVIVAKSPSAQTAEQS